VIGQETTMPTDVLDWPAQQRPVAPRAISSSQSIHVDWRDASLEDRWEALLATRRDASVCATYTWARRWAETVGRRTRICISEERIGENCVALTPLASCVEHPWSGRWLRFLGETAVTGDHLDLLAAPARDASAAGLLADLLQKRTGGAEGAILVGINADSPIIPVLVDRARASGFLAKILPCGIAPYLDLPRTSAEFAAGLSKKMRAHIRRGWRQHSQCAGAELRLIRDPADVPHLLSEFFALHEQRWAMKGQCGHYVDDARREFLTGFCLDAARRGWLRGTMLATSAGVQGAHLAFHYRGQAAYYQMGWRPDGPLESPGVLLIDASIRQAIDEGLDRYDFLRGDEAYKRHWTRQSKALSCVQIAVSSRARAWVHARDFLRSCRGLAQRIASRRSTERAKPEREASDSCR
jgi:CelD/BcsL family acetyltransferase involved in cellulose biosynthesis